MKNRLEAELISIAHRILKLKNKSEIIQLQQETLNLYEKLSILRFVEENYDNSSVEIPNDIEEKIEHQTKNEVLPETENKIVEENTLFEDNSVNVSSEEEEEIIKEDTSEETFLEEEEAFFLEDETTNEVTSEENEIEEEEDETINEVISEEPILEEEIDEILSEKEEISNDVIEETKNFIEEKTEVIVEKTTETKTVEFNFDATFEEFEAQLANAKPNKNPSIFDETEAVKEPVFISVENQETKTVEVKETETIVTEVSKSVSINDAVRKNFNIGLNDRIAFEFHLFGGKSEDFNRVISQLNTFGTFTEANDFIQNVVKPDYNNWFMKDEYESRFLEIIESKFS